MQAAGKALLKGAVPISPVKGVKSAAEWQAVGLAASPAAAKTRRRKKGKVLIPHCPFPFQAGACVRTPVNTRTSLQARSFETC